MKRTTLLATIPFLFCTCCLMQSCAMHPEASVSQSEPVQTDLTQTAPIPADDTQTLTAAELTGEAPHFSAVGGF